MKKHRQLMKHRDVNFVPYLAWCTHHEKKAFTKRGAKKTIRILHDSGMRRYPCRYHDGWWHIGHLDERVKQGLKTATEIYGGSNVQRA